MGKNSKSSRNDVLSEYQGELANPFNDDHQLLIDVAQAFETFCDQLEGTIAELTSVMDEIMILSQNTNIPGYSEQFNFSESEIEELKNYVSRAITVLSGSLLLISKTADDFTNLVDKCLAGDRDMVKDFLFKAKWFDSEFVRIQNHLFIIKTFIQKYNLQPKIH